MLQIAYEQGTLEIVDIKNKQRTTVIEHIAGTGQSFSWSSDGAKLVYSVVPTNTHLPELWIMDAEGIEQPHLLLSSEMRGNYNFVTWLPNKENILFAFIPTVVDPFNRSVYQAVNINSGETKELFTNGRELDVSNEGHRITFNREFIDGKLDLSVWIATLD